MGAGILVGISGSTGVFPGPSDLSASPSTATDTIYELWQGDEDPLNSLFDLDMTSVCFVPQPGGGFSVECEEPTGARPDLQIGKSFSQLKGGRGQQSPEGFAEADVGPPGPHFQDEHAAGGAALAKRWGNGGESVAEVERRPASPDESDGALGRQECLGGCPIGSLFPQCRARRSVRVLCRVQTNRFYAGGLRNGDRDDTIRFRLTGGGGRDNAAMVIKYIGPAGATRL